MVWNEGHKSSPALLVAGTMSGQILDGCGSTLLPGGGSDASSLGGRMMVGVGVEDVLFFGWGWVVTVIPSPNFAWLICGVLGMLLVVQF